jgi:hypothetical protein
MKRIVLTMKGADNVKKLYVLPTDNHFKINEMIEHYGLTDYKLINWKIENITILN